MDCFWGAFELASKNIADYDEGAPQLEASTASTLLGKDFTVRARSEPVSDEPVAASFGVKVAAGTSDQRSCRSRARYNRIVK